MKLSNIKDIKINYSFLLLLAYLVKLLIFSADYPDALIIGFLAALYGYRMRIRLSEPRPIDDKLKKDVEELKNALSKVNLSKIAEPKKYF